MNHCFRIFLGSMAFVAWGMFWTPETFLPAETAPGPSAAESAQWVWEVCTFETDITIPIGHACMGGGVADAKEIVDPLWAKGFVLRPVWVKGKPAGQKQPEPKQSEQKPPKPKQPELNQSEQNQPEQKQPVPKQSDQPASAQTAPKQPASKPAASAQPDSAQTASAQASGGEGTAEQFEGPPRGKAAAFPIVVVALDWCQCNNHSYDRWREVLAEAAGTTRQRVFLATVHQHDAPICDLRAQELLDQVGKKGWNCDPLFHEEAVQRTAKALKESLRNPRRVSHLGLGQAKVDRIASNRRIVTPEGRVHWGRSSASGDLYGKEPEGEIDPWLKTLSLWDGDKPVVAWSCYAVHPMSYYGRGQVSADFPGMARARRQKDDPEVFQMYFTGCAGDTTAGKYNNGDPANRPVLADRLYQAMLAAWKDTQRYPLEKVEFRSAPLYFAPRDEGKFTIAKMKEILADEKANRWERISAALGLSWRERLAAGRPIDVPCLDFNAGQALFVILPAESFVGYQLAAQRLRPESFVMVAGFGDGAPGYIPTDSCWKEGYNDEYCWVAPMTDRPILEVLRQVLAVPDYNTQVPPPLRAEKTPWNSRPPLVRMETIHQELNPEFLWFHPRAAAVPGAGQNGQPAVILTLQKHLVADDYYSGLYYMRTDDLGKTWRGPIEIPELAWVPQPDGRVFAVCDVTPGYHPPTGKLLAIGASIYYDRQGRQLPDRPTGTAYALYDPKTDRWLTRWHSLETPDPFRFCARNACSQWLVEPDGSLLLPIYYNTRPDEPFAVTVFRCRFDGQKLTYQEHGDLLRFNEERGLCEPSIIKCGAWYYLTIRHDLRGYVTRSKDGLHWEPIRPWTFDDGTELGSYNTQQHWVAWGDQLYLVYTRRGAQNDHIARHRAPLFIGQVDPEKLCVLRATEKVVLPERGAQMGNFGAAQITDRQWWVTVGEYVYRHRTSNLTHPDPRGGDGSVLLGRLCWPEK